MGTEHTRLLADAFPGYILLSTKNTSQHSSLRAQNTEVFMSPPTQWKWYTDYILVFPTPHYSKYKLIFTSDKLYITLIAQGSPILMMM